MSLQEDRMNQLLQDAEDALANRCEQVDNLKALVKAQDERAVLAKNQACKALDVMCDAFRAKLDENEQMKTLLAMVHNRAMAFPSDAAHQDIVNMFEHNPEIVALFDTEED